MCLLEKFSLPTHEVETKSIFFKLKSRIRISRNIALL